VLDLRLAERPVLIEPVAWRTSGSRAEALGRGDADAAPDPIHIDDDFDMTAG
jgi:hypothetical protein